MPMFYDQTGPTPDYSSRFMLFIPQIEYPNMVKVTFYIGVKSTLLQQIGVRLMLTGLLFAAIAGLADILGFGSHIRDDISDIFFGSLQGIGIIACFP